VDEEAIFAAALDCATPELRRAFVQQACAGDARLRALVEGLLQAHDHPDSYLQAAGPSLVATRDRPVSARPGTVIGPYKLMEQIGEGGMGLVFVAEQQRPVGRRVALKIIKPGMDSRQVIARFEAERQALAMMDHPNIAKVYDGGTIPGEPGGISTGRPYFVMELVKGTPITDYCDTQRLTTRDRLKLFLDVCHAVQHAHQKGIIHRDLKPSNVLVEVHDVRPVVKVIDFGIAKATGGQLTDKTLFTGMAQMIGTPLYMSPEQAGLSSLDVDTRSDVYSLGVVLYELLTGTTPFDSEALKQADYDEMRRIIREDEPPRPSTRLSTLEAAALSTVADKRGAEPRHLSTQLRGELDWIVMKALEKDRNRRYESASALAADLQRYLDDEPVQACPPSTTYRLKKLARRHKGGLAVAAGVLVVAATLACSAGWVVRDRAARRAEVESRVAEALEVAETRLPLGNPHDPELMTAARKAEAQLATGVVGDGVRQHADQVLADLAMLGELERIRLSQARVTEGHFDLAGADAAYAQAFRSYGIDVEGLAVPEAGAGIRTRPIGPQLAVALDDWALARREQEKQENGTVSQPAPGALTWTRLLEVAQAADPDPWRGSLREALATGPKSSAELQKLVASAPVEELPASTLALLGDVLRNAGALSPAEQVLREGQQRYPADFWLNHHLAFLLENELKPPQLDEAIACYRVAVALRPQSPGVHLNFGTALQTRGQLDKAIAAFREAKRLDRDYADAYLALGGALYRKRQLDQAMAEYRAALRIKPNFAEVHNNLGLVLADKGDVAGAIQHYREALRLKKELPEAHYNLGNALRDQGDGAGAIKHYQEALRLKDDFFEARANLGAALAYKGQWDQAIAEHRKALQLRPGSADEHRLLGQALSKKGLLDEAGAEYRAAIRLAPQDADSHGGLGAVLGMQGKLTEAIACFRDAIRLKPAHWEAHDNLGTALRLQGDLDGAIQHHREAVRLKPDYAEAHYNLGAALAGQEKFDEALASLREAVRLKPDSPGGHNNLAWMLASCPDQKIRDPREAVKHAKKAIELAPGNGNRWTTLGVAQYRNGNWKAAVESLTKSVQLRKGGDGTNYCFLAMAHWQLGEKDKARTWYDQAVAWMDQHKPQDEELRRFRAEAAELLGIPKGVATPKDNK
jgi:serine/threonine-protein kinase